MTVQLARFFATTVHTLTQPHAGVHSRALSTAVVHWPTIWNWAKQTAGLCGWITASSVAGVAHETACPRVMVQPLDVTVKMLHDVAAPHVVAVAAETTAAMTVSATLAAVAKRRSDTMVGMGGVEKGGSLDASVTAHNSRCCASGASDQQVDRLR